jgi:hypothetical protein
LNSGKYPHSPEPDGAVCPFKTDRNSLSIGISIDMGSFNAETNTCKETPA